MASTSTEAGPSSSRTSWFSDAHLGEAVAKIHPAVCQIVLYDDDEEKDDSGTGFLIGNRLLMTCNHVFDGTKPDSYRAHFCYDKHSILGASRPFTLKFSPQDFFYTSPSPGNGKPLQPDKLDFTIVALEKPKDPDTLKELQKISKCALSIFSSIDLSQVNLTAHIIHHARTLEKDKETELVALKQFAKGTPVHFIGKEGSVHYYTNTSGGASGAPVFDGNKALFALHREECRMHNEEGESPCNAAVSIQAIVSHLKEMGKITELEKYLDSPLLETLKRTYLESGVITLLISERRLSMEQFYTRLAMIREKDWKEKQKAMREKKPGEEVKDGRIPTHESIFEPKEAIELEKLFEHEKLKGNNEKRVLIFGAAGMGKSTLCDYIVFQWANENLWKGEFDAVFRVWIRYLNRNFYPLKPAGQYYTPHELVAAEHGIDPNELLKKLGDRNFREKTLLILDGYDELPKEIGGRDSLAYLKAAFEGLFDREMFPNILITSRPQTVRVAQGWPRLEILGFDTSGIKSYVHGFFSYSDSTSKKGREPEECTSKGKETSDPKSSAKDEKLCDLMKRKPMIRSLAHIPINLEILCSLFDENPELFDSVESLTVSSIYDELTDWLYRRFLLSRGNGEISVEDVKEHPNIRKHREVNDLAKGLERLAWDAMVNNTLFISAEDLVEEIDLSEARMFGMLRIEGRSVSFVHLTFQERSAGVHLASYYIDAQGKNREKAKLLIAKYKFHPRFARVLSMAAGYLSNHNRKSALQAYFDDLFNEPYDLGVGYELALIGRCFEECKDPAQVDQWEDFVNAVEVYIRSEIPARELFLNAPNLLCKKRIKDVFFEGLTSLESAKQEGFISSVRMVVQIRQNLPIEIIKVLTYLFSKPNRTPVADVIEDLAEARGRLPEEIVLSLIQILINPQTDSDVQHDVASILGKLGEGRKNVLRKVHQGLAQILTSPTRPLLQGTISALKELILIGGEIPKEAIRASLQLLVNLNADPGARANAAFILGEAAKSEEKIPSEVFQGLLQLLGDSKADLSAQMAALDVLEKVAKSGEELPKKALKGLLLHLYNNHFSIAPPVERKIRDMLGKIAITGKGVFKEVVMELVRFIANPNITERLQKGAAFCLRELAVSGAEFSKEALQNLVMLLKDPNLERFVQLKIIGTLETIAEKGETISEEAVERLLRVASDSEADRYVQERTVNALGTIVKSKRMFSKKAFQGLFQLLVGPNSFNNLSLKRTIILEFAKTEEEIPSEIIQTTFKFLTNPEASLYDKGEITPALIKIVKSGNNVPKAAIRELIQPLLVPDINFHQQRRFISALVKMVKAEKKGSKAIAKEIERILTDSRVNAIAQGRMALILVRSAKDIRNSPKEAIQVLTNTLINLQASLFDIQLILFCLKDIAKEGCYIPNEVIQSLVKILTNPEVLSLSREKTISMSDEGMADSTEQHVRMVASTTLKTFARLGIIRSIEAIRAISRILIDSRVKFYAHCPLTALEEIVRFDQNIPRDVIQSLSCLLANPQTDPARQEDIAYTLMCFAKEGVEFPRETVQRLFKFLADPKVKHSQALKMLSYVPASSLAVLMQDTNALVPIIRSFQYTNHAIPYSKGELSIADRNEVYPVGAALHSSSLKSTIKEALGICIPPWWKFSPVSTK